LKTAPFNHAAISALLFLQYFHSFTFPPRKHFPSLTLPACLALSLYYYNWLSLSIAMCLRFTVNPL